MQFACESIGVGSVNKCGHVHVEYLNELYLLVLSVSNDFPTLLIYFLLRPTSDRSRYTRRNEFMSPLLRHELRRKSFGRLTHYDILAHT